MANLGTTQMQLSNALQLMRQRWEASGAVWNDNVRWDFEKNYWMPLEHQTQTTLNEMERLAGVIGQAYRSVK